MAPVGGVSGDCVVVRVNRLDQQWVGKRVQLDLLLQLDTLTKYQTRSLAVRLTLVNNHKIVESDCLALVNYHRLVQVLEKTSRQF